MGPILGGYLYRELGYKYLFITLSIILLLVAPTTKILVPKQADSIDK